MAQNQVGMDLISHNSTCDITSLPMCWYIQYSICVHLTYIRTRSGYMLLPFIIRLNWPKKDDPYINKNIWVHDHISFLYRADMCSLKSPFKINLYSSFPLYSKYFENFTIFTFKCGHDYTFAFIYLKNMKHNCFNLRVK